MRLPEPVSTSVQSLGTLHDASSGAIVEQVILFDGQNNDLGIIQH